MEKKKYILKEQSSMRVVLNGGKHKLDDATIPFQIGFTKEVAEKNPAYVLVIDIGEKSYDENGCLKSNNYDYKSERSLFKLEPVNYLQLKRPGIHHLIFIVLNNTLGNKIEEFFLMKDFGGGNYTHALYFRSIEDFDSTDNNGCYYRTGIAYCENIVEVPEELFAIKPEKGIRKYIYQWINLWYHIDPIDQCENRKRAITAFTTQPIFWLIGFLARLILVTLWVLFFCTVKIFFFLFGYQPVRFIPSKEEVLYDFLVCYPRVKFYVLSSNWWMTLDSKGEKTTDFYPYKTIAIGKKRIHTPISIVEFLMYAILISMYVVLNLSNFYINDSSADTILGVLLMAFAVSLLISKLFSYTLLTLKGGSQWKERWKQEEGEKLRTKISVTMICVLFGLFLILFIIAQTVLVQIAIAVSCGFCIGAYFLLKRYKKIKGVNKKQTKAKQDQFVKKQKTRKDVLEDKHKEWLIESFNIENLPKKVDITSLPKPSNVTHKLVIKFWATKAKVCKPYAK